MYYFSTLIGETPVSVLASQFSQAREVLPVKRGPGRPAGSKNKPKPETTRPSCPTIPKAVGAGVETVLRLGRTWRALGKFSLYFLIV